MKQVLATLILIGLLAGGVFYNIRSRNQPPASSAPDGIQTAAPQLAPSKAPEIRNSTSTSSISVVGVVKADRQAVITSKVPARIAAIIVHAGDKVRPGSPLVRLEDRDLKSQAQSAASAVDAAQAQYRKAVEGKRARRTEMAAKVAEARGGLATALAKLHQAELGLQLTNSSVLTDSDRAEGAVRQAEAGMKQAESGLSQTEDTVKRLKFLYDRGGLAKVDLEGAQTQLEIARAQRDSARAALDQAKSAAKPALESAPLRKKVSEAEIEAARAGVRQAEDGLKNARRAEVEVMAIADRDIEAARAQVSQAKAGLDLAGSQAAAAMLSSSQQGVVVEVTAHQGEMAQPGQPLMTVASLDSLLVEAGVPTRQAGRVRAGESARIIADTSPGRVYHGVVSRVLPATNDGRTITVQIRLESSGGLLPGLGVTVEIAASEAASERK